MTLVDVRETVRQTRARTSDAIDQGGLDGFLVAFFRSRYESVEVSGISPHLGELAPDQFVFTREGAARMGIALERGWITATPEQVETFHSGVERLRRQQPSQAQDYRVAPRLLYGVARGAIAIRTQYPEIAEAIAQDVRSMRETRKTDAVMYVVMSALLADLVPGSAALIGDEVSHYLLAVSPEVLSDRDAYAAVWALEHHPFPAADRYHVERDSVRTAFVARALRAGVSSDDLFEQIVADAFAKIVADGLSVRTAARGDALAAVMGAFDSFSELARSVRDRRKEKTPFDIVDEYDVQDLMYVALKPQLPDLVKEEPTSRDAGSSKHIDLVSSAARLCVEEKVAHSMSQARELGDQLRIDIESYYVHPACDTLAIFVWDPQQLIQDARKFELDISGPRVIKGRSVRVEARVRPR